MYICAGVHACVSSAGFHARKRGGSQGANDTADDWASVGGLLRAPAHGRGSELLKAAGEA